MQSSTSGTRTVQPALANAPPIPHETSLHMPPELFQSPDPFMEKVQCTLHTSMYMFNVHVHTCTKLTYIHCTLRTVLYLHLVYTGDHDSLQFQQPLLHLSSCLGCGNHLDQRNFLGRSGEREREFEAAKLHIFSATPLSPPPSLLPMHLSFRTPHLSDVQFLSERETCNALKTLLQMRLHPVIM